MSRKSLPAAPLWPLIYGLGIVAFSFFLLVLRAGIPVFLIFMVVGVAMIILWVYLNIRTTRKNDMMFVAKQSCKCAICTHEKIGLCLDQKCACCIVVEGGSTIGHTSSTLQ